MKRRHCLIETDGLPSKIGKGEDVSFSLSKMTCNVDITKYNVTFASTVQVSVIEPSNLKYCHGIGVRKSLGMLKLRPLEALFGIIKQEKLKTNDGGRLPNLRGDPLYACWTHVLNRSNPGTCKYKRERAYAAR